MNPTLVFVMIFAIFAVCCKAAPVERLTVDNPCKIDPRGKTELFPLRHWLLSTLTDIGAAQATFQAASMAFVKAGLIQSELEILKPLRLPRLPVRDDSPVEANVSSMVEVLQRDFINIATHVLFIQAFIADELSHDYGRLVADIREAERCLVVLLCKCDLFMRSQNVTGRTTVDSSVVPPALAKMPDAKARLARNYLVMTQSNAYVTSMASYVKGLVESKLTKL